jgi:hypothetical protein
MIKKYKEFLLLEKLNQKDFLTSWEELEKIEQINDRNLTRIRFTMEGARNQFAKKIKGLAGYFESWYSSLAHDREANPQKDFEDMQSFINKTGFTLDIIKKLFDKQVCKLTTEYFPYFIDKNHLDSINGYIDVYLYFLDEKLQITKNSTGNDFEVGLGGPGYNSTMTKNSDEDMVQEWIIKYAYGFHKTPYGKLFIKQLGLTPEEFVRETIKRIHQKCFVTFLYGTNFVNLGDIDEILEEVKEEGGLIEENGDVFKIYLESFWVILKRFLKMKTNYDDFKESFKEWLIGVTQCNDIIDDEMSIHFKLEKIIK